MQIQEELRQFIIENFLFGRDGELRDEDSFLEQGIIDSTGVLELVTFIEERFGIKVQDSDLIPDNLDSIHAVTGFIQRQLNATGGAA
jgi:acyl carrier protein